MKHQPAPIAAGAQHQAGEAKGSEAGSRGRGGVKPREGKPNGKGVRGGKQQGLISPVKSPSGPPFPGRGFPLHPKEALGLMMRTSKSVQLRAYVTRGTRSNPSRAKAMLHCRNKEGAVQ